MNAVYFPNLQASLIVRQIKVEIAILKDCVGLFFKRSLDKALER